MASERYVLPVKARPVVPSAIHSFTSAQPFGSTGCAHFEEGVAIGLVEPVDDGSEKVVAEMISLVANSTSLVVVGVTETISLVADSTSLVVAATLELVSTSLDVGAALDTISVSLDVNRTVEDKVLTEGDVASTED